MAKASVGAIRIIDSDGDGVETDGNGRLHVSMDRDISIGNVDLEFAGVPASVNNGTSDTGTLRVTIASDSTGVLSVDDNGSTLSIDDGGNSITVDNSALTELGVAINGNKMDVQLHAANGTDLTDTSGKLDVYVGGGEVGHNITGMVSDENADISTTAEKIHGAGDVAIKRIDIQADEDNTGAIWVGDDGVVGNGSGGGIRLGPGDFYSLDIDNTSRVYVAAEVDGEDAFYIYYT